MVFMPPRHGKSLLCSQFFPAWYIGKYRKRIILTSYEATFAASWGRLARNVLTEWGEPVFGVRVSQKSSAGDWWELEGAQGRHGVMMTAGVGGAITGKGCFAAGTMVATEYGPIAIERLCLLQYQVRVWAYDHTSQRPVLRRIVAAREIKANGLVEVVTRSGRRIRATADHRFYVRGVGYRASALLRAGDDLQGVQFTAQSGMPGLWTGAPKRVTRRYVPRLLSTSTKADRRMRLRQLRGGVRASALRSRACTPLRLHGRLLLQGMQPSAPCGETRQDLCALSTADAGAAQSPLLFTCVPSSGAASEIDRLPFLRTDVHPKESSNTVLLPSVRERRSFRAHARRWQLALQDGYELRQVVCGDALAHLGARQTPLYRLPMRGADKRGVVAWADGDALQFGDTPHQRATYRQHAGQSRDALQDVSCGTPQVEDDTVAVVRHLRAGSVPVYDIQVEGCHNFFANGILVHNCDLLIIDDPVKNAEEASSATYREKAWHWYTSTAYTRLQPGAGVLVIQTRWHDDDLSGRILKESKRRDEWHILSLPAIAERNERYEIMGCSPFTRHEGDALWPQQFNAKQLADIQQDVGGYDWNALYQQRPTPKEGGTFRREWFDRRYRSLDSLPTLTRIVQSVDSAFKEGVANDYSVIATWGTDGINYYLLDLWRNRVAFPDLVQGVKDQYAQWNGWSGGPGIAAVLIEDKASGQSAIQTLRRETNLPIIGVPAEGSKESRADNVSPLFQAGKAYLPADAPWVSVFVDEHVNFPRAAHDDTVDTTGYALLYLRRHSSLLDEMQRRIELRRERLAHAPSPTSPTAAPRTLAHPEHTPTPTPLPPDVTPTPTPTPTTPPTSPTSDFSWPF